MTKLKVYATTMRLASPEKSQSRFLAIAFGLLFVRLVVGIYALRDAWSTASGYEIEDVASSLLNGHGFSFSGAFTWLYWTPDTGYRATAWVEPVYPFLVATFLGTFGDLGHLVILLLQLVCLLLTCVVVYHLGCMVAGQTTGLLAGTLLAVMPAFERNARDSITNSVLGGLLTSICAVLLVRCLERARMRHGIALGFVLGLTSLTIAAAVILVPLAIVLVLTAGTASHRERAKAAVAVLLACVVTVGPWTARNAALFGRFVPLRTGMGYITFVGNPMLAETFIPGLAVCGNSPDGPPWTAISAADALSRVIGTQEARLGLENGRSPECVNQDPPAGYATFNEAARDGVYLQRSLQFVVAQPRIFADLLLEKTKAFFFDAPWYLQLETLLALMGALIGFTDRRIRALALCPLAYALVYALGVPFFYRYRYPIEPLLLILAAVAAARVLEIVFARARILRGSGLLANANKL
jgi:4-amino-4-deoxy-L-arabinose transferase-like glycosyltransferase